MRGWIGDHVSHIVMTQRQDTAMRQGPGDNKCPKLDVEVLRV